MRARLKEYLIGTGGWAYFHISGLPSLVAYSKAFNFVEVNSTFYRLPSLERVEEWRRIVPKDFQFAVRAPKMITHKHNLQPTPEALESFQKTRRICGILKTNLMHLQTPPSLTVKKVLTRSFQDFLSSVNLGELRLVLEIRGTQPSKLPKGLVRTMQDHNMIHCVDLSKNEVPIFKSDVVYSRLFGRGHRNVYQPTDKELKLIDRKAGEEDPEKAVLSFHFVRMYKDAARLKVFKQTGRFPMVTKSTGLASLQQILREDTEFPTDKQELIRGQGWKLFDITKEKRTHTEKWLRKLPEKTYNSIDEIIQSLKH